MKKIVSVALALMLVLSLAGGALAENRLEKILAAGKITMATSPDFAPMEFIDPTKTGQEMYAGAEVAMGRYIAEQLGVELVIEAMDFSAVQGAITSGKVDMALSGFAYTAERAESMELSIFYNYDEDDGQTLLVPKDKLAEYTKAEDFSGKKIAVQNASLQYNLLVSQLPDAKPELITNLNDAVMMLITNKVDAVGVSGDNGLFYAENYDQIAVCEFKYDYTSEGNVMAVTKGEAELMDAINEIIEKINAEGLFKGWKDDANALVEELGLDD